MTTNKNADTRPINTTTLIPAILWQRRCIIGAFLLVLLPFYILPLYSHPSADDYTYAVKAMDLGFLESQHYWYMEWSGRYFSTAVISGLPLLADHTQYYCLMPYILLVLLPLSIYCFLREATRSALTHNQCAIGTLGLFAVFLSGLPSVVQGLYWLSGSATYMLPTALLLLLGALGIRAMHSENWRSQLALAIPGSLLTAAIVGSNETIMFVLVCLVFCLNLLLLHLRKRVDLFLLIVLVCSILCSAIVFFAPGNAAREATQESSHHLLQAIGGSFTQGLRFCAIWATQSAVLCAGLLLIMMGKHLPPLPTWMDRHRKTWLLGIVVAVVGISILTQFPSFWARGAKPPARTLNSAYLLFLLGWGAMAWIAAQYITPLQKDFRVHLLTIALACSLFFQGNLHDAIRDAGKRGRKYHKQMTQRYDAIRQARAQGSPLVELPPIRKSPDSIMFRDITPSPDHWRNRGMADYFGIPAIRIAQPEASADNSDSFSP